MALVVSNSRWIAFEEVALLEYLIIRRRSPVDAITRDVIRYHCGETKCPCRLGCRDLLVRPLWLDLGEDPEQYHAVCTGHLTDN